VLTGAGKSIIIGFLGLALGDRTDISMIKEGAQRADITARFDCALLPDVQQVLQENELAEENNECILNSQWWL